jgi:hypothetical protein
MGMNLVLTFFFSFPSETTFPFLIEVIFSFPFAALGVGDFFVEAGEGLDFGLVGADLVEVTVPTSSSPIRSSAGWIERVFSESSSSMM